MVKSMIDKNCISKLRLLYGNDKVVESVVELMDADDKRLLCNIDVDGKNIVYIDGKIINTRGKKAVNLCGSILIVDYDKYKYKMINIKTTKHIIVSKSSMYTLKNGYFIAKINKRLSIVDKNFNVVHDLEFIDNKKSIIVFYMNYSLAPFSKKKRRIGSYYTEYMAIRFVFINNKYYNIVFNTDTGKVDTESTNNFYRKKLASGFSVVRKVVDDKVITSLEDWNNNIVEEGLSDEYIDRKDCTGLYKVIGINMKTNELRNTDKARRIC